MANMALQIFWGKMDNSTNTTWLSILDENKVRALVHITSTINSRQILKI